MDEENKMEWEVTSSKNGYISGHPLLGSGPENQRAREPDAAIQVSSGSLAIWLSGSFKSGSHVE